MRVRRLGWAGIELEAQGSTVVIDPLLDATPLEAFTGAPREALLEPTAGAASLALVTHMHADHADIAAIERALAPGGELLRPAPARGDRVETAGVAHAEALLARSELNARELEPWESVSAGPFTATAIPAVDGFGDPQIGWVVAAGEHRVLHHGDTLFHGSWWLARTRLGPIDAAFLPVNGPVVDLPHRQPPSPRAAAMAPDEAAAAALILQAGVSVPIHYDTLHKPPSYTQCDDPGTAFLAAAAANALEARLLAPGEWLTL